MKLLFDQNLSRHLVGMLIDRYPGSLHVTRVGLEAATDRAIWEWAGQQGYVVVSKDSDFRQLAFLFGPPPKVVWLRVGNLSTSGIGELLLANTERIGQFVGVPNESLLIIESPS